MKLNRGMVTALLLVSAAAQADKPAWSGEGQPDALQKQQHKEMMQTKGHGDPLMSHSKAGATPSSREQDKQPKLREKKEEHDKALMSQSGAGQSQKPAHQQPKGLSKQQQRTVDEQKELAKGSETGQAAREKRKKWWRFWE